MNAAEVLQMEYQVVSGQFTQTLQDLSAEQLAWRADASTNSIGFTLWHVLRTWDAYYATLKGSPQIHDERWAARFGFDVSGRGVEGSAMGTGFTTEEVDMVKPDAGTLTDYHDALAAQTLSFLENAGDEALGRPFTIPWWPQPVTVARVCAHVVMHSLLHTGEARYLKDRLPR